MTREGIYEALIEDKEQYCIDYTGFETVEELCNALADCLDEPLKIFEESYVIDHILEVLPDIQVIKRSALRYYLFDNPLDNYAITEWQDVTECIRCADCGSLVYRDEAIFVDDDLYCFNCVRFCDRCEEYTRSWGTVFVDNSNSECWCESCRNNYSYECSDCGGLYTEDALEYIDGGYYCEDCAEEHREAQYVEGYHNMHRGSITHWIKGVPAIQYPYGHPEYLSKAGRKTINKAKTFGFELEVDDGYDTDDTIDEVKEELSSQGFSDLIASFEHDGSLSDDGFENITAAMDMATFKAVNWEKVLEIYKSHGWRSHAAHCQCSLHIHYNLSGFFGIKKETQEKRIMHLEEFFIEYWEDLVKASRRGRNTSWCRLEEEEIEDRKIRASALTKASKEHGNRYRAINLTNDYTVEIRLGRGTLNVKSFTAWIDLMYHVVNNAKNINDDNVLDVNEWFRGIEKNTVEYLKGRGAFEMYTRGK